ncbi:sulfate ABC transporter substrate-binding protein [Tumebacillus sp. DT12]|uniref:Sulfate ABC transporter substrate-binding protein n=1 Tax=Tumebacillus lacus TaxID=2995335 RepID=A0ABT3X2L4_9BACL|nr:sulfate ABC transporter substrate-binding protein [Tumebacillus lacus]MCX7571149.1 sulfate ABC transporter substrate-binding protein [Tumebacillus lacus]
MKKRVLTASALLLSLFTLTACGTDSSAPASGESKKEITLTLGAYTVPKEAFAKIIPEFQKEWEKKTGQKVNFQESYEASGAQARAIAGGFEADIAALSLEGDIDTLTDAKLITHDWKNKQHGGMITTSVVALGTREGNPKNIKDWEDLTRPGISVLYPNPKTSGGAQWDINAIYGAGLKRSDEAGAKDLLARIHKNVKTMDKSGRASMTTFENGTGDVVVTYENELLLRNIEGAKYNVVVPNDTIKIENPVAVVDKYVDKHGTREVAEAFVDFLWTTESQRAFAKTGYRPVDPQVAEEFKDQYKTPPGQFDISFLGGWDKVRKDLYADGAIWDRVLMGK